MARDVAWQASYRRWPPQADEPLDGYTLLLPVPGDLPVFVRLALANAALQTATGRVETVVIPDVMTPRLSVELDACRQKFDLGNLRLARIPRRGDALRRLSRSSGSNMHFLQLHAGIVATRTRHALLHDADLFITDPGFMARHYKQCVNRDLACYGVSPGWDPWLAGHGYGHVVATWELMFDTSWMRSFAPWQHRAHHAWLGGEWHGFDMTLYTQAVTPSYRCALHNADDYFVHFNWIIVGYREYVRGNRRPFEDGRFVLLLIRLLSDALIARSEARSTAPSEVPELEQLVRGLVDPGQPVTYRSQSTRRYYPEFREKLARIIAGPLIPDDAAANVVERLRPFDDAML